MGDFMKGENRLLYIKRSSLLVPIGCLTENNFSDESDMTDVTTRDVENGWVASVPIKQRYNIDFSGLMTVTNDSNGIFSYAALVVLTQARQPIEWKIVSTESANFKEGSGFITSLSESAVVDEFVTFSGAIVGTGAPLSENIPPLIDAKWIEIDDAFVYKGTNTNTNSIEVDDMIRRYTSINRYIHARVDALPYTVEANLSIFEEITLL